MVDSALFVALVLLALRSGGFQDAQPPTCQPLLEAKQATLVEATHKGKLWLRLCVDGHYWSRYEWPTMYQKVERSLQRREQGAAPREVAHFFMLQIK